MQSDLIHPNFTNIEYFEMHLLASNHRQKPNSKYRVQEYSNKANTLMCVSETLVIEDLRRYNVVALRQSCNDTFHSHI